MADWMQEELTKIVRVARSVAPAVAQTDQGDPSHAGVEIDVEVVLRGMMFSRRGSSVRTRT